MNEHLTAHLTERPVDPEVAVPEALLEEGHRYSFVQVMRLLFPEGVGSQHGELRAVTIVPRLSLAFPAAEVANVERAAGEGGHRVTVNFLGLYGPSSPLPTFYTEEMLDEAGADASACRDFMDIVHRRLYELYFECWCKYRLWSSPVERSPALLGRLFALVGQAEEELRDLSPTGLDPLELLRYAGILGRRPRSAAGLATMLSDALEGIPVTVEQCVMRTVKIPPEERLRLGESCCTLSVDAVLGEEYADRTGKFRLRVGPAGKGSFESLLPGGTLHRKIAALVGLYLSQPLEYDVELLLERSEVETCRLGSPGSARLGLNTWCFAGGVAHGSAGDTGKGWPSSVLPPHRLPGVGE